MSVHGFDGTHPVRALSARRQGARARVRLHRRLRRLPRRLPQERAGRRADDLRARISVRLAGPLVRHAVRCRTSSSTSRTSAASRCAACAATRAAATTCNARSPSASRTGRTSGSGTSSGAGSTRARRGESRHRSVDREEHRAAAQLRRRADALRPPVPRRRRGAHRAADRRQGIEPRGERRALPVRRASSSTIATARATVSTPIRSAR